MTGANIGGVPFLVAVGALWLSWFSALPGGSPRVFPNDNRLPAGILKQGVLTLRLVVRLAEWCPDDPAGPCVVVPAFAEEGGPPQIPAPLIRVPEGTILDVTVTNALADTGLTVYGLADRPGARPDSARLAAGESRVFRFRAGAAGSFQYGARTETRPYVASETLEETQLGGALIVDAAGAAPDDRVFVISIWDQPEDTAAGRPARSILAMNGRSWPFTERLAYTAGDSVHWRVVNASRHVHPMHMHGFYFRVTAVGTPRQDSLYPAAEERLVVTESMLPLSSFAMAFQPSEEGNWLFHCHLIYHIGPDVELTWPDGTPPPDHATHHMAGLVLGFSVAPRPGTPPDSRANPTRHRVVVRERPEPGAFNGVLMTYALDGAGEAGPLITPAPMLVLYRNAPTDVTVVNRLAAPTAIHWHGLELESASDGVAGWSRTGARGFEPIAPGDSFVAHLRQRRAGTFIYHTHLNEAVQFTSGLYGPLIVLEPGQRFDPVTDHVILAGRDGEEGPVLLNGDSLPPPMRWSAGIPHRIRLINIMPYGRFTWRLRAGDSLATWRALARDGADLPSGQQRTGPAVTVLDVGETADFELPPSAVGSYRLDLTPPNKPVAAIQPIVIGPERSLSGQ